MTCCRYPRQKTEIEVAWSLADPQKFLHRRSDGSTAGEDTLRQQEQGWPRIAM
jgi:hypothetical protein